MKWWCDKNKAKHNHIVGIFIWYSMIKSNRTVVVFNHFVYRRRVWDSQAKLRNKSHGLKRDSINAMTPINATIKVMTWRGTIICSETNFSYHRLVHWLGWMHLNADMCKTPRMSRTSSEISDGGLHISSIFSPGSPIGSSFVIHHMPSSN